MKKSAVKLAWSNKEAREALAKYEGIVRMTARRLKPVAALGQALDEEDLCAEGRVAVLEALATYQGFGIEEQTWVRTRVRQRMIDAIRRLDLRSRDEVRLAVKHAAGETSDQKEAERGRAIAARRLVSLDAAHPDSEPMLNRMGDQHTPAADNVAHTRAQRRRLLGALQILPPRQREAIELGLFEGLALREIGDRMGISESRVCQLQKRAVQHLQKAIAEPVDLDTAA
ncbi:MAG TPA: sigma-70 family RNA polymerase sigma factor [Polyangiaceae bacterium LLY-WYZ-14_1]|jgi:RNA polymerase sigma factor for flagellar operon FliA|nr:sigma-70 family RNA polymerase sigma factor [Polyangiaceae bacterium LLY-WYZ-14_1]